MDGVKNENITSSPIQKSGKTKHKLHRQKKRASPKLAKREIDVYVSTYSLQSQLSKCKKLFEAGHSEIVIHGLGHAINTAVNLSLQLQEQLSNTVELAVNTSTVQLVDDFEPLSDNEEPFCQVRSNSAIHIRVFRKANFTS